MHYIDPLCALKLSGLLSWTEMVVLGVADKGKLREVSCSRFQKLEQAVVNDLGFLLQTCAIAHHSSC